MPGHEVVIVGGGAAGIAVAASLLRRRPGLDIAIVEPSDTHDYQPGFSRGGAQAGPGRRRQRARDPRPQGMSC